MDPHKNSHHVSNISCNIGTINVAVNHLIKGRRGNTYGQHHSYSHRLEQSTGYCHLGNQPNDSNRSLHIQDTHGQPNSYSHGRGPSSRYCNPGYQRSDWNVNQGTHGQRNSYSHVFERSVGNCHGQHNSYCRGLH